MISITVKTLDSQNHEFSVDDDLTVRQFKDCIAERTTISADSQRLIYCGRVLMDDKLLREYDVNGKVVHLVQRAPPSARGNGRSSNSESNNTPNVNIRGPLNYRAIDGVVLGAVSIPMNSSNGTPQAAAPSLNPSSTLCMNRITVARYMLECANNIAAYLEDPSRGLNNTAMDILAQQTMESTVLEVGISAVTDIEIPQHHMHDIVQAFQGAVSAAFRQNGINNFRVMQPGEQSAAPTVQMFADEVPPGLANLINAANPSQPVPTSSESEPSSNRNTETQSTATSTSAGGGTNSNADTAADSSNQSPVHGGQRQQTTSTQTLAEVVQQMRNVQTRLEPFVQQYYDILLNDPAFEESNTTDRESSQRVFDRVSEALHYMSHAQHAISDLMLDLSTNVPRHLCCRPILVEQSAYVSSGIALPNHPVLTVRRPNGNNNDQAGNLNNNNPIQVNTETPANQETPSAPAPPPQQPRPNLRIGATQPNVISMSRVPVRPGGNAPSLQVARLIQAVMETAPLVHVEINGPSMTTSQQTSTTTTTSNTTDSATNGEANQPRVTTATHPTTSTQTRSTARPHVQLTNIPSPRNFRPVPANMLSAFDRFLPCNSHHIRETQQNESSPTGVIIRNHRPSHRVVGGPSIIRPPRAQSDSRLTSQRATAPTTAVETNAESSTDSGGDLANINSLPNIPIRILGNQVLLRDLINSSPPIISRIRNSILSTIQTRLFNGTEITEDNLENAVNQSIVQLESFLQPLSQLDLPDYDTRRSVENLIRNFLSSIFVLIRDDDSSQFGVRLVRDTKQFVKRFFTILYTCTGLYNSVIYTHTLMSLLMSRNIVSGTERDEIMDLMGLQWSQLDVAEMDVTDIRQFIVIRRPAPGENIEDLTNQTQPMETDETEEPRPMNVDNEEVLTVLNREELVQPPSVEDDESLPSVVIGSEPWHCNFPTSSWIPVITRDIGRQRRQSPQAPFSDAYISGMSSKRRKIISETKPAVDVPSMISDGIKNVISSSGISTTSNAPSIDEVTAAISSDPIVQCSYKEALKTSVQERLKNDPNYNAERFPNSSKYFNNQN